MADMEDFQGSHDLFERHINHIHICWGEFDPCGNMSLYGIGCFIYWSSERMKSFRSVFQRESISGFQSENSKPVINGDLVPLPALEATLTLARRRPGLWSFSLRGPPERGRLGMLFHQPSVGSQFGLGNKKPGWRGERSKHTGMFY